MTAEEFFRIPEDGYDYELIDGVVVVSPSPTPRHQFISGEIYRQLADYAEKTKVGLVLFETDVQLGRKSDGKDLVYCPEVLFIRAERVAQIKDRIVGPPDLMVEVVSSASRSLDSETKKNDYEQFGVGEYWLIDPEREAMAFYRLEDGRFLEVRASGDDFSTHAVPGFKLDLARIRKTFRPW